MDLRFPSDKLLQSALVEVLTENPSGLVSQELDEKIAIKLAVEPDLLLVIHSGTRTEFAYRLAWARTKAKKKKLIKRDEISRKWQVA